MAHLPRRPQPRSRPRSRTSSRSPHSPTICAGTRSVTSDRRDRCRTVREFLAQLVTAGLRLGTLTVPQVDDLLAGMVRDGGYARVTVRDLCLALRALLPVRGRPRLGAARAWRSRSWPREYSATKPCRSARPGTTSSGCSRLPRENRPVDIRDRAVLMLLAVYGLRAGEVTGLVLEDFDWEQEVLSVPHGKSQKPRTYPLCRPVGDAVLRYLREVRPRSDRREVFLTLVAPFRPLAAAAWGRSSADDCTPWA